MPLSPHFSVSTSRPMAQDLDRPSTGASGSDTPEYSAHMRSRSTAHAQSPKRLSVFSGRSRSNTTTSTSPSVSSSRRSPASSMTSTETAPMPPAHEDRTTSAAGVRHDRHESVTKSLLLRGSRILRRQGSKINMVATLDEEEEMERDKSRFEVSEFFGRHHKARSNDAHEQMKRMISDPFDFHHLTHTSPSQFNALDKTRQTDLVTEFSAIRASQKPVANLKGIRAEDIHMRSLSAEDLSHCLAESDDVDPLPASPPRSPGARSISPRQLDYRPLRESRVFENFSRPVSRYPRVDSPTSPPRASSPRLASSPEIPEPSPRVIDEILGLNSHQAYPEHVYSTDEDSTQSSSFANLNLDDMLSSSLGHAISTGPEIETIDNRTVSALNSPTSELEDVPEEDEATHWHDSPESQPLQSPRALGSQAPPEPVVARSKCPSNAPRSHLSINVAKELSKKFSEALGSPTLPQYRSDGESMPNDDRGMQTTLRRQSSVHRKALHTTIYESWEDDIDYCYEHAAESTSNFDWARNSLDEPRKEGSEVTDSYSGLGVGSTQPAVSPLPNPRYLGTLAVSSPDLQPSPSRSTPSSCLAITLSTAGYESELVAPKDGGFFHPVSSSALSTALTKHISPDSLYEDYLATDGESDRHFSFCSQSGFHTIDHPPVSPRSSFSPISKCNSQESLILSRAASIVRKHRSSVSTTSVPELVHSLASSRDFSTTDLMLPGETGLARQDSTSRSSYSSHHRQTKSLAREIETQIMSRPDGNASTESTKLISMGASVHDRAKSTSDMEAISLMNKADRPELPPKSGHRRKGRTSYSLFPSPTLPTTNA
ncbi:hypothetical protein ASPCAL05435 [Aspergillus calidoustus]|uniref:CRIB domain-containing protein n=1 Tax=Aspergillus calidoustus TaxID=454130 RepID=A0A0U5FXL3_ASPCI|nr:hypothetical protein ASPCAL05435 [Aspergillus calidoustus]